jgi:hypothetical protein
MIKVNFAIALDVQLNFLTRPRLSCKMKLIYYLCVLTNLDQFIYQAAVSFFRAIKKSE